MYMNQWPTVEAMGQRHRTCIGLNLGYNFPSIQSIQVLQPDFLSKKHGRAIRSSHLALFQGDP